MPDTALFLIGDPVPALPLPPGTPRVQIPERHQVECLPVSLDQLVETDHQVRVVWDFVQKVDLSLLDAHVLAFEGRPGRAPICHRVLLALWLFATLRGVGSARRLAELCEDSIPYRWLCGAISVNYHTLADFRSGSAELFERVMINHIAALRATGLVTLDHVAHDGVRVRASAGTGSFRGKETLAELRQEAIDQVTALRAELEAHPAAGSAREKAARIRAARERQERIDEALSQLPDVEAKKKDKKKKARVSITDPIARVMKMPNGGFNPAFNVQFSAETKNQFIVSAGVSSSGSDHGLMVPAVERIQAQSGDVPAKGLFDGGFANLVSIETLSKPPFNMVIYAPPTEHKDKNGNVLEPKKKATPAVQEWRDRMKTPEAQEIYKERASTIECVNAQARNRGLQQLRVRGLAKVKAVVLLFALAHNLAREASLKAQTQTA